MTTLQDIDQSASGFDVRVTENFDSLSAAAIFGRDPATTAGLVWGYLGGLYNGNTKADGTVTLTNAADNYVVVLRSTGVVSVSTSSTNSVDPLYAKLYKVTCAGGVVTAVIDQRFDSNGLLFAPSEAAASIHGATAKTTPVDADEFGITDSAASYGLKKLTWANVKAGIFAAWGSLISTATAKATPVNADAVAIMDSAASNATKSLTFTSLKAFLKTYFDTVYAYGGITGSGLTMSTARLLGRTTSSSGAIEEITVGAGLDLSAGALIFVDPSRTVTALSIAAGVVNIDCSLGDYFTLTLTANVTSITFSNLPGSGKGASKWIEIVQGAGPYTVAWPASFKWANGAAGAVSTANAAVDDLAITSVNNGTAWRATLAKAFA